MSTSTALLPDTINLPQDLLHIYHAQVRLILIVCMITVIGLSLSVVIFYNLPGGIGSPTQIGMIGLLALHLILHGLSARIERRLRLAMAYLLVQMLLLFAIQVLTHYPILLLFLPPLIAEIVVIFESLWLAPITLVISYTLLFISQFIPSTAIVAGALQATLTAIFQGMILSFMGIVTPLVAYYLLIRARQQTGGLLIKLDQAHRQLAVYAEQVEHLTVTAERARMARELHDTLAQGVAGLVLQLEALDSQIERGDDEQVAATLVQIKSRARAVLKTSREAIDDLRLGSDHRSMILNSIAEEADKFTALTGIVCTLSLPESLTLPTSTTEHTLRFVSEGLANITKHATASAVSVRVQVRERDILLEIQDNGIGFDPAQMMRRRGHYGLLGLQERARLVGGKFEIESAANAGTTLRLYLPKLDQG